MKRIPTPSPAMVVAMAGVVIGLSGIAFASIPDSGGTIHACFHRENGSLRVVESQAGCRAAENVLEWSQRTEDGGARAYAHVFSDGRLDPGRSANVTGVYKPNPGGNFFCIGVNFTPVNAVATPEPTPSINQGHSANVSVDPNIVGQRCPEPEKTPVLVDTVNTAGYTSFYVVIR